MSKLSSSNFSKYQGAGNDFILIDDRASSFNPALVPSLCHRKFGIGADGVILLQNDFRMRIYNADGSEAESCGNGLRCLVRFLIDLGIKQETYQIKTKNRTVTATVSHDEITTDLGEPHFLLHTQIGAYDIYAYDTGVPHAVIFVPDVTQIDVQNKGSQLRYHPVFFPRGVNVNFATIQESRIHVRTYERGLEAESSACGTGAAAVAFVAQQKFSLPNPIQICFAGGSLKIAIEKGRVFVTGRAEKVFDGFTPSLEQTCSQIH